MAESMVFSSWSRTVIPFPSLHKKIQTYQDENRQTSAWNKGQAAPYFPTQPSPNVDTSWKRPELDGSTGGIGLIL